MGSKTNLIAAIAMGAASTGVAFAQPSLGPAWQVDWGDEYCTLVRLPDQGAPFAIAMRTRPGSFAASMNLIPVQSERHPGEISSVSLEPSDASFEVTRMLERTPDGLRVVALYGLPDEFWDALSGASEVQLKSGTEVRERIALHDARVAVTGLRQCVSAVMREWGLDEASLRALQQRPATTNFYGIGHGDYPESALRQNQEGQVVVRITVSPEGRATDCATLVPSGTDALDSATCRIILRGGEFSIPLDGAGQPTSARIVSTVRWSIPD